MEKEKTPNEVLVDQLREQFEELTKELKPEMEPAVVYGLKK